jgi:uncharacterized protein DUF4230
MKKIKFLLIAIAVCIILVVGIYFISRWNTNQQQNAAVILQIRTLNRWETASYTVQQIIDNGTNGNVFQQFLFGNRILLIAQGTVIAGFDLANISNNSIQVNGKSITLQLPAPEILSASLDESQTRVYDRQKGLFVPSDNNLESEARVSALNKIKQAACSEGIVTTASGNAKKQLTTMMQALGFTNIVITIPQGHC